MPAMQRAPDPESAVDSSMNESEIFGSGGGSARRAGSPSRIMNGNGPSGPGDATTYSSDASDDGTDLEAATKQEETEKLIIATRETTYVRCLRVSVLLILLSAAALCATVVYLYTRSTETQDFDTVYEQYAQLIVDSIHSNAQHKLEAVASIAEIVQAHAISSNSTWPFVTVPFFEEHVLATKSLTNAYGLAFFPIVSSANRRKWEKYSVENRGWINNSYAAQRDLLGKDDSGLPPNGKLNMSWFDFLWGESYKNPRNPDFSSGIGVPIFRTRDFDNNIVPVVDTGVGPYYPQWQAASMSKYYQTTVNSNYGNFADFHESVEISEKTGDAVIGEPWFDPLTPGNISTIVFPIFDAFHGTGRQVVAFLGVDIFWQDYISQILPSNATGIFVVIESSKGDKFTFALEGNSAVSLGDGDLHDPAYDAKAVETRFGQYLQEPLVSSNTKYTGTPLYNGFYQYNFTVYPSQQLESVYITSNPLYYTLGVLGVFLFTSMVFVAYDCIVERRQRIVMSSAQRSDAIVSSLFPSTVKNQLYRRNDDESKNPMLGSHGDDESDYLSTELGLINPNAKEGPPIAELYSCATVLFADIAGFTSWSSSRPPQDVFTMLESLYSRFDKKARARGVFKVETIGDCYMACTGIPKPTDDHALIMAKFARDMVQVFEDLQISLLPRLGNAMMELGLRVGMHSGPVTAGVLRGDRARFQLFGDTVNTASRMESNGKPMQIQVSEATATLLRERNKGHWLSPRVDMVVAKGKGEMQTYWLTSHSDTHRTKSSSHEESSSVMDIDTDLREALEDVEQKLKVMGRLDEERSIHGDRLEPDRMSALQAALSKRLSSGRSGSQTPSSERLSI